MGQKESEDLGKDLETLLGLSEDDPKNGEVEDEGDESKGGEGGDEGDESKNKPIPKSTVDEKQATTVIDALVEQKAATVKELVKVELQIEELKGKKPDTESFYDNIETHLSEEEQALEFEDKTAFMKLIGQKAKEFEDKNSSKEELLRLEAKEEELKKVLHRQDAITAVIVKHPMFDYEKVFAYFENNLSKEQQQSIYDQSQNYEDVYEKTFILFANSNKINIKSQEMPQYPNVNNARKQSPSNGEIDEGMSSDDQKLANALGL